MDNRVFRVNGQSGLVFFDCIVQFSLRGINQGEVIMDSGLIWLELQSRLKFFERLIKSALLP